jgi:hypothetical protein
VYICMCPATQIVLGVLSKSDRDSVNCPCLSYLLEKRDIFLNIHCSEGMFCRNVIILGEFLLVFCFTQIGIEIL